MPAQSQLYVFSKYGYKPFASDESEGIAKIAFFPLSTNNAKYFTKNNFTNLIRAGFANFDELHIVLVDSAHWAEYFEQAVKKLWEGKKTTIKFEKIIEKCKVAAQEKKDGDLFKYVDKVFEQSGLDLREFNALKLEAMARLVAVEENARWWRDKVDVRYINELDQHFEDIIKDAFQKWEAPLKPISKKGLIEEINRVKKSTEDLKLTSCFLKACQNLGLSDLFFNEEMLEKLGGEVKGALKKSLTWKEYRDAMVEKVFEKYQSPLESAGVQVGSVLEEANRLQREDAIQGRNRFNYLLQAFRNLGLDRHLSSEKVFEEIKEKALSHIARKNDSEWLRKKTLQGIASELAYEKNKTTKDKIPSERNRYIEKFKLCDWGLLQEEAQEQIQLLKARYTAGKSSNNDNPLAERFAALIDAKATAFTVKRFKLNSESEIGPGETSNFRNASVKFLIEEIGVSMHIDKVGEWKYQVYPADIGPEGLTLLRRDKDKGKEVQREVVFTATKPEDVLCNSFKREVDDFLFFARHNFQPGRDDVELAQVSNFEKAYKAIRVEPTTLRLELNNLLREIESFRISKKMNNDTQCRPPGVDDLTDSSTETDEVERVKRQNDQIVQGTQVKQWTSIKDKMDVIIKEVSASGYFSANATPKRKILCSRGSTLDDDRYLEEMRNGAEEVRKYYDTLGATEGKSDCMNRIIAFINIVTSEVDTPPNDKEGLRGVANTLFCKFGISLRFYTKDEKTYIEECRSTYTFLDSCLKNYKPRLEQSDSDFKITIFSLIKGYLHNKGKSLLSYKIRSLRVAFFYELVRNFKVEEMHGKLSFWPVVTKMYQLDCGYNLTMYIRKVLDNALKFIKDKAVYDEEVINIYGLDGQKSSISENLCKYISDNIENLSELTNNEKENCRIAILVKLDQERSADLPLPERNKRLVALTFALVKFRTGLNPLYMHGSRSDVRKLFYCNIMRHIDRPKPIEASKTVDSSFINSFRKWFS